MGLIFAGDNFVHVILATVKKMITLFEKLYFGEPVYDIFSKIQTMLF